MVSLTVGKEEFRISDMQLRELFLEISVAERKVRKDLIEISDKIAALDNMSFMLLRRDVALELIKLPDLSDQDLFDVCFDIVITSDEIKKLDVAVHENLELQFDLKSFFDGVKRQRNYKGFLGKFVHASHKYHHDPEFMLLLYFLHEDLNEYFISKKSIFDIIRRKTYKNKGSFVYVLNRLNYTLDVALDIVSHESGKYFFEMLKELLKHDVSPDAALVQAVKRCDVEFIEVLLDAKANPNAFAENGDTLLDICIDKGEVIVAEILLDHNADPNLQNREGETPLLRACKDDNLALVDLLITNKADVNLADQSFNTPLIAASDRGNMAIIDLLFKNGADWKNIKMLFRAGMQEKRRKYIQILIERSVKEEEYVEEMKKNTVDADEVTLEICKHEYELVLNEMGDKTHFMGVVTPDNEQEKLAEREGQLERYKLDEMLTDAVIKKNISKLKEALEKGADPNMDNPEGLSNTRIIHIVVWHGDLEMLKLICEYGADVNIFDVNGDTPIFFAVYKENQAIFKFLMEKNADIYLTNNAGVSAYDLIMDRNLEDFLSIMKEFDKMERKRVVEGS